MTEHNARGSRLRDRLVNIILLFGITAGVLTIVGFAGALWWPFDLFSHFRVQYLLGLFVIGAAAWLLGRRRLAALFLVLSVLNLAVILPLYISPTAGRSAAAAGDSGSSAPCRFMLLNVRTVSTAHERVAAEIQRVDPDVLVLVEVDDRWLDALAGVTGAYAHASTRPQRDNFGIAVYSRHLMDGPIVQIGPSRVPSIVARIDVDDHPMTLIATHPVPPVGSNASSRRNAQLAALGELIASTDGAVMVLGDLNATPWCAPIRALLRESGLRDASRGHGINATWPAPMPPLAIPIDQCLHSADIEIVDERVGRRVGSDHRPLIVDARIRGSVEHED